MALKAIGSIVIEYTDSKVRGLTDENLPRLFSNTYTQNIKLAPQVGLEPTTLRLTAECSAIELLRNKRPRIAWNHARARRNFYNRWVWERQAA